MERRLIVSRLQFCLRSNFVIGDMRISIFYDDGHPPSPACCGCKYGLRYVNRTADQNLNKPLWEPLCRLVREMFKTPITSPPSPKNSNLQSLNTYNEWITSPRICAVLACSVYMVSFEVRRSNYSELVRSTVILYQHKKGPKAARYIQGISCST